MTLRISDGGRAASGKYGRANDCSVRSLAHVEDITYQEAFAAMVRWDPDRSIDANGAKVVSVNAELIERGYRRVKIGRTATVMQVAQRAAKTHSTAYIIAEGHAVAMVGGLILDTFDSRHYPVRFYYVHDKHRLAVNTKRKSARYVIGGTAGLRRGLQHRIYRAVVEFDGAASTRDIANALNADIHRISAQVAEMRRRGTLRRI